MFITAGYLNTITAASSSIIQSVQQVSITVASGSLSNTATISAVDTANTILVWGGTSGSDVLSRQESDWCAAVLTNGTTVTVSRLAAGAVTVTVKVTVLEFATNVIDSIQSGVIAVSGGTKTANATITSVVAADSLCHFQGHTFSVTGGGGGSANARIMLVDPTTITATRAATSVSNLNTYYSVARFKPGILHSSTQQIAFEASAVASGATTIVSVDPARSVFFWGNYSTSALLTNARPSIQIQSPTQLSINRNDTVPILTVAGTIVEFKSSNINNVQRGVVIFTSADTAASAQSSATATITSANISKSVVLYGGARIFPNTIATSFGQSYSTITISSPTEIKAEMDNKTLATTIGHRFEVISFK